MPLLQPIALEGIYQHPRSGRRYAYAVNCQVVVNRQGWESMHVRGKVWCSEHVQEFWVLGHVDPETSLLGREAAVARDCVALACEREAADAPGAARPLHRPAGQARAGG